MFNAESLRIVGAMVDDIYLCRKCAEKACNEDTDIVYDDITTSVLQYWLSQDHGERYTIRNLSESDYNPEGIVCGQCSDVIFEASCVVCGDVLDNDAKYTGDLDKAAYQSHCKENRVYPEEGQVCSDCLEEIDPTDEEEKEKETDDPHPCDGCPGIAVSFCLVPPNQRNDCESFPKAS